MTYEIAITTVNKVPVVCPSQVLDRDMAEVNCPQIFVVDPPASSTERPIRQKPLWKRALKSLLPPLFALVVFGLVLEGIFIYRLHKRTEALFLSRSLLQDQSSPHPPAGNKLGQLGSMESNDVRTVLLHPEEIKERPMAHLRGSINISEEGVVQWVSDTEGFTSDMGYNSTGLVIKTTGFYYLYSKVHFQEIEDCVMVNHRVVRNTTEYGLPIELMRSKSLYCRNECRNQKNLMKDPNLWNSFLAGAFKLETGDHIFVTLDKGLYPGPYDNFFGAFKMI